MDMQVGMLRNGCNHHRGIDMPTEKRNPYLVNNVGFKMKVGALNRSLEYHGGSLLAYQKKTSAKMPCQPRKQITANNSPRRNL